MAETPAPTENQPGVTISQIFLDSLLFQHSADALSLPPTTPANVGDVNVRVESGISEDGEAGVTFITVSTQPDQRPVYNVILKMVGLFQRTSGEGMRLEDFIKTNSVALLYPFVREAFANVTQRGRFGPVWLTPANVRNWVGPAVSGQRTGAPSPTSSSEKPPEAP
jgi:preprotein translocase subunit SecB